MGEKKDVYRAIYEQQDSATQQKLSELHNKIEASVSASPLGMLENSVTGKAQDNGTFKFEDLIAAGYAKRISKDVLVKHLTGQKNERTTLGGKISQKVLDKVLDIALKQENSYDSVLIAKEKLIVDQFKTELDELKSLVKSPKLQENDKEELQEHEDDEVDYDDLEGGDTYADGKDFSFNVPMGLPIAGITAKSISSHQGHRHAPKAGASTEHNGIDIRVKKGTDLIAPGDGKVITVANQPKGAGLYVEIDHGDYITRYFHLDEQNVKVGDIVKKGQVFAKSGNSGNSTGPHLHYEVRKKNEIVAANKKGSGKYKVLDPEKIIDFDNDGQMGMAA